VQLSALVPLCQTFICACAKKVNNDSMGIRNSRCPKIRFLTLELQ
jgi:hypothetical protein